MPVEIIDVSGKVLQMKIRGMLKKADYDRIIQIAKEAIAREGKISALIIAEGFGGWERKGDTSRRWPSWVTRNGKTTRWLSPQRDFVQRPSSSFQRHARMKH